MVWIKEAVWEYGSTSAPTLVGDQLQSIEVFLCLHITCVGRIDIGSESFDRLGSRQQVDHLSCALGRRLPDAQSSVRHGIYETITAVRSMPDCSRYTSLLHTYSPLSLIIQS